MKTAIQKYLAKGTGIALLLALGLSLSSCIIVDRRHHRYPYRDAPGYSQGVRP